MNAKIKKTPVNNDLNISSEKLEKNRDYDRDRNVDRDREDKGRNREKDRDREKEKEKYYNTYEDKTSYEKSNSRKKKQSFHNTNYEKQKYRQNDWEDDDMKIDDEEKVTNLQKIMTKFLSEHTIYEAIPEDMKILVFNNNLLIKDSIEAMIKEDIYCGLLWDKNKNDYTGVFTIRDVLELLLVGYEKLLTFLNNNKKIDNYETLTESMNKFLDDFEYMPKKFRSRKSINENSGGGGMARGKGIAKGKIINKIHDDNMEIEDENFGNDIDNFKKVVKNLGQFVSLFENITLQNYLDIFKPKDSDEDLVSLNLDANLEECINTIQKNGFHRLVVKDKKSASVSGFITYEAVFEFFIENYYSSMTEFNFPVKYLNVITKNIISLNKKDTLYNCMKTFYEKEISMIPIMDNNDNIFGYFYLKDIIYFFSTGDKFNFNDTIENFLIDLYEDVDDEIPYGKKRIVEINEDTNLKQTFEEMSVCPERKLIVHKNQNIGIITLYDIFRKLVV